jgi:hypothetical protein
LAFGGAHIRPTAQLVGGQADDYFPRRDGDSAYADARIEILGRHAHEDAELDHGLPQAD